MRNCWTFALLRRLTQQGQLVVQWRAYGYVPRLKWTKPELDYCEFFTPKVRVPWASLSRWKRLLPWHVLDFDGIVVLESKATGQIWTAPPDRQWPCSRPT